jgi:hypothetical protein
MGGLPADERKFTKVTEKQFLNFFYRFFEF